MWTMADSSSYHLLPEPVSLHRQRQLSYLPETSWACYMSTLVVYLPKTCFPLTWPGYMPLVQKWLFTWWENLYYYLAKFTVDICYQREKLSLKILSLAILLMSELLSSMLMLSPWNFIIMQTLFMGVNFGENSLLILDLHSKHWNSTIYFVKVSFLMIWIQIQNK